MAIDLTKAEWLFHVWGPFTPKLEQCEMDFDPNKNSEWCANYLADMDYIVERFCGPAASVIAERAPEFKGKKMRLVLGLIVDDDSCVKATQSNS